MSAMGDVSNLIQSLGGGTGVVALFGGLSGLAHVIYKHLKKKEALARPGQSSPEDGPVVSRDLDIETPASAVTGATVVAMGLAALAVLLAAVLDMLVAFTSIGLTHSGVHDLELGLQVTFFGTMAFALFSLVGAIGHQDAARTVGRAVASLLAAILALVASGVVGAS
jgi:hypothetical protein